MSSGAKRIARLAVMTALGAIFLLLTGVVPAGRLGLMVIASFPVCVSLMLYGPAWATGVFACTAGIGFLLISGPVAIGYAAFFGYYPIVKSLCERCRSVWLAWGLKYAVYFLGFAICWFLANALFAGAVSILPWWAVLLIGAAVFAVYDFCYSLAIRFYIDRLARYFT